MAPGPGPVVVELAKLGFSNISEFVRREGSEGRMDLSQATEDDLAAIQEDHPGRVRRRSGG